MTFTPILITLFAGLATVLGAAFIKNGEQEGRPVAFSLAFATGIMLMVALGELIPEATEALGVPFTLAFLVLGVLISLLLDVLFPHHHENEDGHEEPGHYLETCECSHSESISRGMIIALVLHNIVEGLATGVTAVTDVRLGFTMALGIAIHNLPIGATLAVSVLSSGKTKKNALLQATLVGLSQPLGALIGVVVLGGSINSTVLALCMAVVAGILVFISFDELWPAARKAGSRNLTITALLAGICFIPLTEMLF